MLYILDDDQFNLISTASKYAFILNSEHVIRYYKNEEQIDFEIDELNSEDFVCYHNSFPCDKMLITNRLVEANESKHNFYLICFSAAGEFLNLLVENKFIKIYKDRFYNNLSLFIDSGFDMNTLLYGENSGEVELSLIQSKINTALFAYTKSSELPIKELVPSDLKRICELKGLDYPNFIKKISEFDVEHFRKYLNILIQNK